MVCYNAALNFPNESMSTTITNICSNESVLSDITLYTEVTHFCAIEVSRVVIMMDWYGLSE